MNGFAGRCLTTRPRRRNRSIVAVSARADVDAHPAELEALPGPRDPSLELGPHRRTLRLAELCKPKRDRNEVTSDRLMFVRPTIATDWCVPSIELL